MAVEALPLCKVRDPGGGVCQRLPGVVDELGLLHKVVYAEGTGKPGRTAGGQGVVGTREIVPQRLWRVAAQKNAAGVFDQGQQGKGIVHAQLQMLRSDAVGGLHCRGQVLCHQDLTVGL